MKCQARDAAGREELAARLSGRTVVVISGGTSSEREISLRSGREMLRALNSEPTSLEAVHSLEISPEGQWQCESRSQSPELAILEFPNDTVFLLGLHGGEGENGVIQGILEAAGRAYTASGVTASALCMDKYKANALVTSAGLRCAPGLLVTAEAWAEARSDLLERATALSKEGWFVKPNSGGSSVATTSVADSGGLASAIELALATGDHALVEARILGVECSCGVLGNHGDELVALPPIEIRPHAGRFFDYDEKYREGGAREICPAESFDENVAQRIEELSKLAHHVTGCDGYSRVDFIMPREGDPVFLEVNTLPGFTARSLLPQEAKVVGIEFPELLHEILGLAMDRFERERKLS